jgi:hypothetical protein
MRRLLAIALLTSAIAWAVPVPAGNADVPERYISVDDAKALLDRGQRITFIDVREKPQYDGLHITGAINIPLNILPVHLTEISRSEFVVLY